MNYLADYLDSSLADDYPDYIDWLKEDGRQNDFVAFMMYTLPSPRIDFYSYENYQVIQDGVLAQTNQVIEMTGLYPIQGYYYLLFDMEIA